MGFLATLKKERVIMVWAIVMRKKTLRNSINYLVFMAPTLILFIAIGLVPFFSEIWYSFTNWNGIQRTYDVVGIKNYINVLNDTKYWSSMWFTIKFTFYVVIFSNLIGFTWAYGLSKAVPFRNVMRAGFYLPRIVGGVILGFLWRFIFSNLFPILGKALGISWLAQAWFTTASSSFWAMVIVMTWSMSGYMMIIYLAGITSISRDYMEVAIIDGARSRHLLRYIIIPLIMPSVTQCLFLSVVNSLRVYDLNISLTNGNPFRLSEAVTMNVFQTAFSANQLGYGAAKALVLVAVIALTSLIQVAVTSRKEVVL